VALQLWVAEFGLIGFDFPSLCCSEIVCFLIEVPFLCEGFVSGKEIVMTLKCLLDVALRYGPEALVEKLPPEMRKR
jgi:hypothetical protein